MIKLFYGEDQKLILFEIEESFLSISAYKTFKGTTDEVLDAISQSSFIEQPRNYLLSYNSKKEFESAISKVKQIAELANKTNDSVLICVVSDSRIDFEIIDKENIHGVSNVTKSYVSKYIKSKLRSNGISISDSQVSTIISKLPYDMSIIRSEISKIITYYNKGDSVGDDFIEGVISIYFESKNVYDVLYAFIVDKKAKLDLEESVKNDKLDPIQIIYSLYSDLLAISEYKKYLEKTSFFSDNGIPSFKMKLFSELDSILKNEDINYLMNTVIDIEITIKTTNTSKLNIFKLLDIMIKRYTFGK
jgi:DNA polymerase III delta subunit